ncbi:MAG: pyridoxal-phosphate dependent enzyme [Acidimicrobiales bacterium]|nr:pyridoxal-phosphate dependent enzyme [Acidimicrobiales bacterium]
MPNNMLKTYLEDTSIELEKPQLDTAIGGLARFRLGSWPTVIDKGPVLPSGRRLWIKRDDLTGIGLGGNKLRKLEFLLGQASLNGCDVIITSGAAQSNHCRLVAACGAMLGFEVHLVLASNDSSDQKLHNPISSKPSGNQLLMELFGATLHFVQGSVNNAQDEASSIAKALLEQGRKPYEIVPGGSNGLGAIGYAIAFSEIMNQMQSRSARVGEIYVSLSTGGTLAGLCVGRALFRQAGLRSGISPKKIPKLVGVDVAPSSNDVTAALQNAKDKVKQISWECLEVLKRERSILKEGDINIIEPFSGDNYTPYGFTSPESDDAMIFGARRCGIILDPTYTAKAMAGLLICEMNGDFDKASDPMFLHTGGHPAFFAQENPLFGD